MPNITIEILEGQLPKPGEKISKKPFTRSFKAYTKQNWAGEDVGALIKLWEQIAALANDKDQSDRKTYQKRFLQLTQKILQEKLEALTYENLECFSDQLAKDTAFKLLRDAVDFELLQAVQKKIQKLRQGHKTTSGQPIENSPLKKYAPYIGVLLIGCVGLFKGIADGFNGVNALLGLVGLSGTPVALVIYAVFILTGIAVYITFDYNRICNALGVPLLKVGGAIKKIDDECQLLEKMCDEFRAATINLVKNKNSVSNDVVTELTTYKEIMRTHIQQLTEKRKKLEENQPSYAVRMAGKVIMAIFGGSLFFSSGFFTGYSLALGLSALVAVSPGLAIGIGLVVAAAALISYIFLEGSEAFKVVDGLAGTSEKLLNRVTETSSKLVETQESLQIHLNHLERSFKGFSDNAELQNTQNISSPLKNIPPVLIPTKLEKSPDISPSPTPRTENAFN